MNTEKTLKNLGYKIEPTEHSQFLKVITRFTDKRGKELFLYINKDGSTVFDGEQIDAYLNSIGGTIVDVNFKTFRLKRPVKINLTTGDVFKETNSKHFVEDFHTMLQLLVILTNQ